MFNKIQLWKWLLIRLIGKLMFFQEFVGITQRFFSYCDMKTELLLLVRYQRLLLNLVFINDSLWKYIAAAQKLVFLFCNIIVFTEIMGCSLVFFLEKIDLTSHKVRIFEVLKHLDAFWSCIQRLIEFTYFPLQNWFHQKTKLLSFLYFHTSHIF